MRSFIQGFIIWVLLRISTQEPTISLLPHKCINDITSMLMILPLRFSTRFLSRSLDFCPLCYWCQLFSFRMQSTCTGFFSALAINCCRNAPCNWLLSDGYYCLSPLLALCQDEKYPYWTSDQSEHLAFLVLHTLYSVQLATLMARALDNVPLRS